MKRFRTRSLALALYLSLGVVIAHMTAVSSFAEDALTVSIGGSTWSAKEAYSHDLTRNALKEGKTGFTVSSSAGDSYQIRLSEKQIADILAGSTVVVSTDNGDKKVKIGPKKKAAPKSGW